MIVKFKVDGFHAYCITEDDDGCYINDGQGFVMEADQMLEVAYKMIKYAESHKRELELHNESRKIAIERELGVLGKQSIKRKPKKSAYIYIFKCGEFYKIGYTEDVERRIKQLDYRPYKVELVCVSALVENAFDLEQDLHESLKKYRLSGEWYDLPQPILIDTVAHLQRLGNKKK